MSRLANAALLALFWLAITGSFTPLNAIFGFVLALLCLYIVRERAGSSIARVRPDRVAVLALVFVKELVVSAWRVAMIVMRRDMALKPAIFAYPLTVDRDFEITLLANLITLTPGTLSVDVSDDRRHLYVHAIDGADPDQIIRDIHAAFERRILEAFR